MAGEVIPLFSYWSGPFTWMERVSAVSAASVGHPVTIFTYEPEALKREGLPVNVEHAADIIPSGKLPRIVESRANSFANIFRLEGIRAGRGTWFDLDIIFLKPLPDKRYLLGTTDGVHICNALMKMPEDSPLLTEYLAFCRENPRCMAPPWWSWPRRANVAIQYGLRFCTARKLPRIQTGPPALTYFAARHSVKEYVAPVPVFYPVHFRECRLFLEEDRDICGRIRPETLTVHLWRAAYVKQLGGILRPSRETWLGQKCDELIY